MEGFPPIDDESQTVVKYTLSEDEHPVVPSEFLLVVPPNVTQESDTETAPLTSAPVEPTSDRTHEVLAALAALDKALGGRLEALQNRFDREVRAEQAREKVVDRLHAELQEYKQDLLMSTLRPVFVDLIQLHDDIGKIIETQTGETEENAARLLGFMRGFQQGIEDILYRQGVEPFQTEDVAFDPRRQRALATVPTVDPGLARSVASRLRKGFQAGAKVIRPELVSVYAAQGL